MGNISHLLVSNSTQLDNVDLMGGPRDFTITAVAETNDREQPLNVTLAEYHRPWKPGLTMRRLLAGLYGEDDDKWVGKRVRLFRDESVSFGKQKTGGTRISHASNIDRTITLTLPISKGKFGEFKVEPLIEQTPPPADDLATRKSKAVAWFAGQKVQQSVLEAHVSKPVDEWDDADLQTLKAASDEIVSEVRG